TPSPALYTLSLHDALPILLAFLAAFDEATFVNFVGGPDLVTLPKAIFDSLRLGVDPLITGIATILMALTGVTMMLAVWLRQRHRSEEHTSELQSRGHLVCR